MLQEQEAHQLVGQATRRATKIGPKAVIDAIFQPLFRTSINADQKQLMTLVVKQWPNDSTLCRRHQVYALLRSI